MFFLHCLIFGSITSLQRLDIQVVHQCLLRLIINITLRILSELFSGQIVNMSQKTWKKILETRLIEGEIDGLYKEWYPNGVLKLKGNFAKGKRRGSSIPGTLVVKKCMYLNIKTMFLILFQFHI